MEYDVVLKRVLANPLPTMNAEKHDENISNSVFV